MIKAQDKIRPNVVFIVVDDMNTWSILKDYAPLKTPYIDKLKSESLNFINAVCAVPVCIPSRTSFFTGIAAYHTGAYFNNQNTWNSSLLSKTEVMPETFKISGYTTWGRGKIFHVEINGNREKEMFDNKVMKGGFGPFAEKEYWYAKTQWFSIKPWTGPDTDFPDVRNANAAIDFFKEKHDKPFFMYYGLFRPHSPYTAPKRFYDLYKDEDIKLPPGYLENDLDDIPLMGRELVDSMKKYSKEGLSKKEVWLKMMKGYCANTSFADWNVGRVLQELDNSEYGKNTIVIFVSDNGFHNGTKDHWVKATLWEQADKVPFLIRMPDKKAYVLPQTVSLVDIYPTLIEYCSLKPTNHKLDGNSMVPIFNNPKFKWNTPGFSCYGENYSSVRDERYRYIRYPDGSDELYDHSTDPYEHKNISQKTSSKEIIKKLSVSIPSKFAISLGGKKELQSED
ncbi:hypothetical protein A5893_05225 [Pedobacter psychrophilus]|uniref:Sulfatase N-terminal domain-containing protein n=2 Tax=Pedobacter psychrophilus TaxID=1826909 RepID=A0A179DGZ9_9SPHI|nr:hypothetical protein A5893_05225 [Pedobacter psychrophilus]